MVIIGITGGVGCGKSAVLEFIEREYNSFIVDTDKLAHSLQCRGKSCYKKIVSYFGPDILDKDGIIDRKKLGSIVFNDKEKRQILNGIVHPAVTEELRKLISEKKDSVQVFIIEAALLLEANLDALCDEIWYIYADEEIRRERLKSSRGYSDEKITDMMKSQLSQTAFFAACDRVIDNNNDLEQTFKQIREELAWLDNMHCPKN